MEKIVFIDRDGVINVDLLGDYIKTWEEFRFEKGSLDALQAISALGYGIVIVSNQAGIGDGIFTEDALWDIHGKMLAELEKKQIRIRATYYCLHGKNAGCRCRKPATGLFEQAAKEIQFNPQKTFFIGDKSTDVEAGIQFGVRTIFVRTGHGQFDEKKLTDKIRPDFIVDTIQDAVEILKK